MDPRRLFGNQSERQAELFLKKKGCKILGRQFSTRYGEIDLIACDGDEIVFVEVKARRSKAFGHPEESVTSTKLQKIAVAGEIYLQQKGWLQKTYRIDVIAIDPDMSVHHLIGLG